jgi:hypothetical protein
MLAYHMQDSVLKPHFCKKEKTIQLSFGLLITLLVYIQRKWSQCVEETSALPCLLQHYSQKWNNGSRVGWMTTENVVKIHSENKKKMKSYHLWQHRWNWRSLCSWNKSVTERHALYYCAHTQRPKTLISQNLRVKVFPVYGETRGEEGKKKGWSTGNKL